MDIKWLTVSLVVEEKNQERPQMALTENGQWSKCTEEYKAVETQLPADPFQRR